MIIENEFTVAAEVDPVWRQLLDMEGVASCLPGATIEATDRENVYDGSMRLKIGPMRVEYRGTATLSEIDERKHTAVISLSAREARGPGSAMATIRNRLEPVDGGTRVVAETDLRITGPQAQFGRGVIEDVGKRVLGEFAQRLEQRISSSEGARVADGDASVADRPAEAGARPVAPTQPPAATELDVGALVTRSPAVQIGAAGLLLLALVLVVVRRRNR